MNEIDIDEEATFYFSSEFGRPEPDALLDGFNEYGVKEVTDDDGEIQHIDIMYRAMEPGPPERRKGVRITDDFLQRVASKEYNEPPFMLDHSDSTLHKLGHIREVAFQNESLYLITRVPNTGSSLKTDVIADFTHKPPAIRDGSLGFGNDYAVEVNDDGEPELIDATIVEFSATTFPGGYDNGGVQATAAFSDAIDKEISHIHDEPDEGSESGNDAVVFTVQKRTF